jgi:hypothetical protein
VGIEQNSLHSRMKGKEHRETSSPPEKPLTYHLSPREDHERNSQAASSEESTGSISSPESERISGSSKALLPCPTTR